MLYLLSRAVTHSSMSPVPRPQPPSAPEPEPVSFEAVFRAHYSELCEFVTGYVRSSDVAHELVQDLFLRIWELQGTSRSSTTPAVHSWFVRPTR
jgi:DNA-directed RNA polymerase specialized sigma24 family protein